MLRRSVVLIAALVTACGSSSNPNATTSPAATRSPAATPSPAFEPAPASATSPNVPAPPTRAGPQPGSVWLPLRWSEVKPRSVGVYRGVMIHRATTPDPTWCTRVTVNGKPREWCAPEDQPLFGVGWAPDPGAPAWIVTEQRDDKERPWIAVPCADGACGSKPDEKQLTKDVACAGLDEIQNNPRRDDLACAGDADCKAVTANCWSAIVNTKTEPRVRAVRDAWLATCHGPGKGMCPAVTLAPACVAGVCGAR